MQVSGARTLIPTRRSEIVDLAFTQDGKLLVSLSSKPDYALTYWRWETEKPVAQQDIKIPVRPPGLPGCA